MPLPGTRRTGDAALLPAQILADGKDDMRLPHDGQTRESPANVGRVAADVLER